MNKNYDSRKRTLKFSIYIKKTTYELFTVRKLFSNGTFTEQVCEK